MTLEDLYTDEQIDDAVTAYIEAQGYSDWVDSGTFDFSAWSLEEQVDFIKEWT
jgi:hypothetical protein